MEEFQQGLKLMLSSSQSDRLEGEKVLKKYEDYQNFHSFLIHGLRLSEDQAILSAIIFRQKFVETLRFKDLLQEHQEEIITCLLSTFQNSQSLALLKQASFLIIRLLLILNLPHEAIKLLPSLTSNNELLIHYISTMLYYWPALVLFERPMITQILFDLMTNPSGNIQILSAKTLFKLSGEAQVIPPQLDQLILSVISANSSNDQLHLLLETIAQEFNYDNIRVLKANTQLIRSMIMIIKDKQRDLNRISAIEVLLSMDFSKCELSVLQEITALAFMLMTEINLSEDPDDWSMSTDINAISNDSFSLGKDLLAALVKKRVARQCILELIQAHLKAPHWVHQHTGIFAFGVGITYSQFYLSAHNLFYQTFSSQNERVQWAYLCVLSQLLLTYPKMKISNQYWEFLSRLITHRCPPIQIKAIFALRVLIQGRNNFEHSEDHQWGNFFELILSVLSTPTLKPEALNELLDLVAVAAQANFTLFNPFSNKFSSGFLNIIFSAASSDIKASAIKSLSCLIELQNSEELSNTYFSKILELYGNNDIIDSAILLSVPQFFKSLTLNCYPYVQSILGVIYNNALINVGDCKDVSANSNSKRVVYANFQSAESEATTWVVNSEYLERKATACKVLLMLSMMGKKFEDYSVDIAKVTSQLLNYRYNEEVREHCLGAAHELINQIGSEAVVKVYLSGIFEGLFKPADSMNLQKILELLEVVLPAAFLKNLVPVEHCAELVRLVAANAGNVLKKMMGGYIYRCEVFVRSSKINEECAKYYRARYMPVFSQYLKPVFGDILKSVVAKEEDIIVALAAFCDVLEYSEGEYDLELLKVFLHMSYSKNETIRNNAAYGIGLFASGHSEVLGTYLDNCVESLRHIMTVGENVTESKESAAMSMEKIAAYRVKHNNLAQYQTAY